jgi:hypothetical protein
MGTLGIILLIILALFLFYKWIVCVFVNFMNHYLVVPPQVAINVMLEGLNAPFCKLNRKKVFGKKIFGFIPCPLIPYLDIKCISKPDFYDDLGYKDPKQCPKSKKKKKKKGFMDSIGSASTNIFFILVILLFILMYVGFQHGDTLKLKDIPKPTLPTRPLPTTLPTTPLPTTLPALPTTLPTQIPAPTLTTI